MFKERKKSIEYFHVAPENFNCAQSILKGFQEEFNLSEEEIETYRAWGGGRAENGVCGALFAAKRLIDKDKSILEKSFFENMGSIYCRELKKNKERCEDCVMLADRLVEDRIKSQK